MINVVVSRYNKNTDFIYDLNKYNTNIMIYDKENPSNPYNIPINRGNEASVYLKYIIDNYDKLTDFTFFIHDENYSWHHHGTIEEQFIRAVETKKLYFNINHFRWEVGFSHINDYDRKNFFIWYEKYIEPYIPINKLPNKDWIVGYNGCAQFLVHKSIIQILPIKFYEDIYNWILTLSFEEGKMAGYFLEWSWCLFWDVYPKMIENHII
jgi:hypothetical protein